MLSAPGQQERGMRLNFSRRRFSQLLIASTVLTGLEQLSPRTMKKALAENKAKQASFNAFAYELSISVNGKLHKLKIDSRVTLLDLLRDKLDLTGAKKGCDLGQCGACTVLVNGRRIKSCLTLAVMHDGDQVTSIEGLASGDDLHPMQEAFIKHDGFQCGFCTPGQIMSAVALLKEPCGASDEDVRECMSGNLCRCAAYPNIVAAIQEVRKGGKK